MPTETNRALTNALKVAAEVFVSPGTSLVIDGKIGPGLAHAGAALVIRMFLWQPLTIAVIADSLSVSLTGEGLLSKLQGASARTKPLEARVHAAVENGLTIEEVQEAVREDVEDLYLEATVDRTA